MNDKDRLYEMWINGNCNDDDKDDLIDLLLDEIDYLNEIRNSFKEWLDK